MQLLAIAGGAGPSGEDVFGCCFLFLLLPLVVFFASLAVYRNQAWPAVLALMLGVLPYLALRIMVASYQPSDDGDVMAEQAAGHKLVGLCLWLMVVAGISLAYLGCMRLGSWSRGRRTRHGA